MIYFIRAGAEGPVKIGKSYNSAERLSELQCANHETLTLIREIPGEFAQERWLHKHFAGLHLAREWFRFSTEMLTIEIPVGESTMASHRDILDLWPSDAEIARDVAVKPERVRKWRQRRVPSDFWSRLVSAAEVRGLSVSISDFVGGVA